MKRNKRRGYLQELKLCRATRLLVFVTIGLSILIIKPCSGSINLSGQERDSQEAGQEAKAITREVSSLVKKNLLPSLDPALATARRDLFRPSSLMAENRVLDNEEEMADDEMMPDRLTAWQSAGGFQTDQSNTSLLESLDFIYSGLIFSGQKSLALILIDGQALALAEGEEIIPGLRLDKITPEEVLIRDNQGNSRKIKVKENSDD
ncbi:MAG TPA: hypothetical protein PLB50_07735 [Candidatus Saccharicenans sp.]|nr:hypothetical protein [Candidatus Saccharicenans sp.]HUM79930.1 hypothetical protein [Candidatus Saccharicenans sp.]